MINSFKILFLFLTAFLITSCKGASDGFAPGESVPATTPATALNISPIATSLAINNTFNFTATGGTAPYNYSIVSGGGLILTVADIGQFTAPASAVAVTVAPKESDN